jgi:hypothetical protein
LATSLASPVLWGQAYLQNRDGSPRSYWPHQEEDLLCPGRHIIHLDGRDVGKSVCISTDALHFAFTTVGGQGLIAAPHQGHLDTLIEEIEFQLDANPDLMRSIAVTKYGKLKIHRKPYFRLEFTNGSILYFRPAGAYGDAFRSLHVERVWVDEGAWLTERAWKALRLLWTRGERYDLESYTGIHQGTIFGALTLVTGSIWAKASWGVWWTWSSNQLVLFLVLFLFYCAYFMLRFSIEEGPQRERSSAVYALFGVVLIPISFLAIRLAQDFIHPTVFTRDGPQMSGSMFTAFCASWGAVTLLAYLLYRVELTGKRVDADLRELREALE